MFDFHMHTVVSFDGKCRGIEMARAAVAAGLKEICFTDHIDYDPLEKMGVMAFDTDRYNAESEDLEVPGLKIRRGMEFGRMVDNREQFKKDLEQYKKDLEDHKDAVADREQYEKDLEAYNKAFAQYEKDLAQYKKDCVTLGKEISVVTPTSVQHGIAVDIDPDGALVVDFPDGKREAVNSGEVSIRGMYGYL